MPLKSSYLKSVGTFAVLEIDESTQRCAVVDPGGDLERIEEVLAKTGATLEKILVTHGHVDHCAAAAELRRLDMRFGRVHALQEVDLRIDQGEILGLVGESGSGKTTLGRVALGLQAPTAGEVWFQGARLTDRSAEEQRKLRRTMQIVFQDPFGSLNPRLPIGDQIEEGLVAHAIGTATERNRIRRRLRELVRLADPALIPPHSDYVLVGRRSALTRDFAVMLGDLRSALDRLARRSSKPD